MKEYKYSVQYDESSIYFVGSYEDSLKIQPPSGVKEEDFETEAEMKEFLEKWYLEHPEEE